MANTDRDKYFNKEATAGRPLLILNDFGLETIEKLASVFCTDEEIASFMGVTVETLLNNKNKPSFLEYKKRGLERGKATLRRKQFELAMKGNCTMLIWLGRNYLNQSENNIDDDAKTTEALEKVTDAIKQLRES